MKENKRTLVENPYEGLSVLESIDKYYDSRDFFLRFYESVLLDKIRCGIINRILYFFGDDCNYNECLVHLPFAIMMWNDDGDEKYDGNRTRFYSTLTTDKTSVILGEFYWDDEKENDVSYEHKLGLYSDELITLYRELDRMGFFDPKYEKEFMTNCG